MRFQILGSPTTRAFRVLWMFEELGEPYELLPVPPRSEAVLKYNPSGKIPVLLADETPIIDSVAIIQFLADRFGRFTEAQGTVARAIQDSFTQFAVDDLESQCWNYAKHSFILPEQLRSAGAKPAFAHDFANGLAALESRLGDRQYVMGDIFTVPDLLLGHIAGWARACKFDWRAGPVSEYFERVRSRPAFRRAWEIRDASGKK